MPDKAKAKKNNFIVGHAGLIKSLPPLHDVAGMAGIELPKYLGEISADKAVPPVVQETPAPAKNA